MKTVKIICHFCKANTDKCKAEVDRQKRKGRKHFYCSLRCVGLSSHKHLIKDKLKCTKYEQPFRKYLSRARNNAKSKNVDFNLNITYLHKLWEKQESKCSVTSIDLVHKIKGKKLPNQGSIDRIDPKKGYIKGNIRFVTLMFNYARNSFTDQEVIDFCKTVTDRKPIVPICGTTLEKLFVDSAKELRRLQEIELNSEALCDVNDELRERIIELEIEGLSTKYCLTDELDESPARKLAISLAEEITRKDMWSQ